MSDARFQSLFNSHQMEMQKRNTTSSAIERDRVSSGPGVGIVMPPSPEVVKNTSPQPPPIQGDPWQMNTPTTQLSASGLLIDARSKDHWPSSGMPGDPSHDLPVELFNQGWRKFWSKREDRWYYFNKTTNESLWDMPPMAGGAGYDPLTDPLGISGPSPIELANVPIGPHVSPPGPPHPMNQGPPVSAQKRHMNSSGPSHHPSDDGPIPSKKPLHGPPQGISGGPPPTGASSGSQPSVMWALIGPFDFEVSSNVMMLDRSPSLAPPPLPEIEIYRASLLHKLKQNYSEMCHSREGIECPRDSFIRWLIERKTIDRGIDPVLASQCTPELSQLMYREIMADIPMKLLKPKYASDARKQLARYAESAKKMIESRNASPESRKVVKWNVEDAFSWLRRTVNPSFEDHSERLAHLRKQCQPHLNQVARSSVEGICSKIYTLSCEYAKKISTKHWQALNAHGIEEHTGQSLRMPSGKRVHCYPVQMALGYPKAITPCVEICYDTREGNTLLKYRGEVLRVCTLYFQKLEQLYRLSCGDDRKFEFFLSRVYCMIRRYQSLFSLGDGNPLSVNSSTNTSSSHLLHASLPSTVMQCLHKHFGVTFEGFASPFNSYFKQYCSPFGDSDGYFGSRGDFLKFQVVSGSIQLHPPDVEELLVETVRHVERLLSQSQEPLSFIIFTQEAVSDSYEAAIQMLQSSRYKREQLSLCPSEYELRHGLQHMIINRPDVMFKPNLGLDIYFLQNDNGYAHWGPTPERIEALKDSFKLGLDAMRDESHIPVMPSGNPPPASNNRQKI